MQPSIFYKLDKERNLKLTFKAIANLETLLGVSATQWNEIIPNMTFNRIAIILAEALKAEDKDMTPDKVMELVEEYSAAYEARRKVLECLTGYFAKNNPPAEEAQPVPMPEIPETLN